MEGRPFAGFALRPDPAAVSPDDAPNHGKAAAPSLEFLRPANPLKDTEELARVDHVEPRPVVTDEIYTFAAMFLSTNRDMGAFLPGRELDRVGEEPVPDNAEEGRVPMGGGNGLDEEIHPLPVLWTGHFGEGLPCQAPHVDGRGSHVCVSQALEVQAVVDELSHFVRALADDRALAFPFLIQNRAMNLELDVAEAIKRAQS